MTATRYYFRTRVECAGVCSSISECGAFYFDGQKCFALKAPNLILNGDDPSPIQVYMLNNLSGMYSKVLKGNDHICNMSLKEY